MNLRIIIIIIIIIINIIIIIIIIIFIFTVKSTLSLTEQAKSIHCLRLNMQNLHSVSLS